MKRGKLFYPLIVAILVPSVVVACRGGEISPEEPGEGPSEPVAGEWTARAEFGEFTFTVNDDASAITEMSYNFSDWSCGGVTLSGGMAFSGQWWPIVEGIFTIEQSLAPFAASTTMSVDGVFSTATQTCGTWTAISGATSCSGEWTAVPQ